MGLIFQNGFSVGTAPQGYSFTITSDMFNTNSSSGSVCGSLEGEWNGFSGFTISQSSDIYCGVYANLSGYTEIDAAYSSAGIGIDSSGFICNVTWAAGSTVQNGVVKLAYRTDNHNIRISTIDITDTDYLINNGNSNDSISLAGTFNFPATFTMLTPLIDKGGWC